MREVTDKEAIIKIKNGEIDYFTYLVKKYTPQIYNFVKKRLYQKEEADDIVQNAFLSFYKAIERFDEKRPVLPYLFEIVRNEIKMFLRSHKKTYALNESVASDETLEETTGDIERLISRLPAREREALTMVSQGYSYEEIAREFKRPVNTIRTIIRRARLKMKKIYEAT